VKKNFLKLYEFSNSWTGTVIIVLAIIFFGIQAFVIPSGSMISTLLIGDHLFVKKYVYGIPDPHIPFIEAPLVKTKSGHIIDGPRPSRGDIVVFRYPLNQKLHFVKRCVAVSGDEIMFHNKNLYIHPKEGDDFVRTKYKGYETESFGGKLWVKNMYKHDHPGVHYDQKPIVNFEEFGELQGELSNPSEYYTKHKNDEMLFESDFVMLSNNDREQRKYYFGPFVVPEDNFFMMGDNRDNSADSRYWGTVAYSQIVGTPWFVYFSWDDNYLIRWDRIGKSVTALEDKLREKAVLK